MKSALSAYDLRLLLTDVGGHNFEVAKLPKHEEDSSLRFKSSKNEDDSSLRFKSSKNEDDSSLYHDVPAHILQ